MKKKNTFLSKPILIIAFNRYQLLKRSFLYLKNNDFSDVWITIDGPRKNNKDDFKEFNKILKFCNREGIPERKINISFKNLGCRKAVFDGISWFFENNKSGIIIEDDIEIERNYLIFMSYLLEKYENQSNIFSISSTFNEIGIIKQKDILTKNIFFYTPFCRVWGWATWSGRWLKHKENLKKFLSPNPFKCFMSLPKKYRTCNNAFLLAKCNNGEIDTWDYEWNFSHLFLNALSITPNNIYSLNRGFGEKATHTSKIDEKFLNYEKFDMRPNEEKLFKNLTEDHNLINIIAKNCGFSVANFVFIELLKLTVKFILKKY